MSTPHTLARCCAAVALLAFAGCSEDLTTPEPVSHDIPYYATAASAPTSVAAEGVRADLVPTAALNGVTTQTFLTSTSQFRTGTDNQGWWSDNINNFTSNDNYIVGYLWNNFFTFDLAALTQTVTAARLEVRRGHSSDYNESTETYTLYDVSTPPVVLNNNTGTSSTIFQDLQSGVSYGSYTVPGQGSTGDLLSFPLNADGVAAINAAAGTFFSVGGTLSSDDGDDYIMGGTSDFGIQRLVVEFGSAPADSDGDGVDDDADNCPDIANPGQEDLDGDGIGDACDDDIDGDGFANDDDAFPTDPAEWADNDGDGIGDNADPDDDNDGQTDADETACGSDPLDAGSLSPDYDGDNTPDCVDPDDDNDGVADDDDAFPMSNLDPTVTIGGTDTGIGNQGLPDGATFNDVIGACADGARNHGQFVRCVTQAASDWQRAGLISGRDKGLITRTAARDKVR